MNMERLFNSPLEEGYVSIDGLNYNVTVDVIFAPSTVGFPVPSLVDCKNYSVASDCEGRSKGRNFKTKRRVIKTWEFFKKEPVLIALLYSKRVPVCC